MELHTQIQVSGGGVGGAEGQGEQKPVQHLLNASELDGRHAPADSSVGLGWRAVQGSGQPALTLPA